LSIADFRAPPSVEGPELPDTECRRVWFEDWRYVGANSYSPSATAVHLKVAESNKRKIFWRKTIALQASYSQMKQLATWSSSHDPVMDIGLHSPSADKSDG
jgi:hypothetical protein